MVFMAVCEEQAAAKPRDAQYQNIIFTYFSLGQVVEMEEDKSTAQIWYMGS